MTLEQSTSSWNAASWDDTGPTSDQMATVVALAEQQVNLEDQLARLHSDLESTAALLKQVQERDLPEAMSQAGMETFTLKGGRKVSIDTKIVAQPIKDNQPEMLAWLEENDFSDIIKHEVKVAFGKGEDTYASSLLDWVQDNLPKQKFDDKRFVHPMTLNAFVREQMAQQVELPDAFGVAVLTKSVIKRPKTESGL